MIRLLLVLTTACLLQARTGGSESKNAAAPTGNVQNGKELFESYGCFECHGHMGQGGAGARLAPHPIAFAAFSKYVRQPTGEMPPYTEKVVSNSALADIYAFLQSIPQPPAAKDITILKY